MPNCKLTLVLLTLLVVSTTSWDVCLGAVDSASGSASQPVVAETSSQADADFTEVDRVGDILLEDESPLPPDSASAPAVGDAWVPLSGDGGEGGNGENVIHGVVFTVPQGDDRYIPYGGVHGVFTRDNQPVAEFIADERGEFTVVNVPEGNWELMAEQERDGISGNCEVFISYDASEERLILFLNKCGLARFPDEFNPRLHLAENDVKYWQYVNCLGGGSQAPKAYNEEGSASDAYAVACNTCGQYAYDACCNYGSCGDCCMRCGNGLGALGLFGLLGLIGSSTPPGPTPPDRPHIDHGPGPGPGPVSSW